MSLHVSDIRGTLVSLLTEMGLMEPEACAEARVLPRLSREQDLLLACYRSGQIEESAWQAHLDHDLRLADYWRQTEMRH